MDYPSGLKTAKEVEVYMKGIVSSERITELAVSGFLPHYKIENSEPFFIPTEVKKWFNENLLVRNDSKPFPRAIRLVVKAEHIEESPPEILSRIDGLKQMPLHGIEPSVYFLCDGEEVVYVGQSRTPSRRIVDHFCNPQKTFDRVYTLPIPESELIDVETAFIKHIRPSQQGIYFDRTETTYKIKGD
jgi:hypothetical protein